VSLNKPYLLNIETSTDVCSVGLSHGDVIESIIEDSNTRAHASVITVYIQDLLREAGLKTSDLDGIVLSEGPGSYTSLRVGMSVAKGLCFGLGIPLISINTLEALALAALKQFPDSDLICPMIDARRMEVYAALYDSKMECLIDNQPLILEDSTFDSYLQKGRKIILCGNGAEKTKSLFKGKNIHYGAFKTGASNLVESGYVRYMNKNFADLAYFSPNYIKSPNITQAKKKLL